MDNRQHISVREGSAYVDGVKVLDLCTFEVKVTPEVATSKRVGSKGTDRRWLGYDVSVNLTEYRSTSWLVKMVNEYKKSGKTPELTLQGIRCDKNSEYYESTKKSETVTVKGAVPTGDITLLNLDTGGDFVQDNVAFGAKDFTMSV
jgi:hypothetical protein